MRAAQIQDGVVINYAEVNSFDGVCFFDPLGSSLGDIWDGARFLTPAPPLPTEEQFLAAVDGLLNEGASRKRYDSIHSAAIRAGYPGPFHDEGVAYATWMDSVYSACYQLLAQVKAGAAPYPPTTAALLAQLPQCPFAADSAGG